MELDQQRVQSTLLNTISNMYLWCIQLAQLYSWCVCMSLFSAYSNITVNFHQYCSSDEIHWLFIPLYDFLPHLVLARPWWGVLGLVCVNDPPSCNSGSLLLVWPPLPGRLVARSQTKKHIASPGLLGVDCAANNPTLENLIIIGGQGLTVGCSALRWIWPSEAIKLKQLYYMLFILFHRMIVFSWVVVKEKKMDEVFLPLSSR